MPLQIVRLGAARAPREGVRIGTVRRPPRGVPRERHAKDNWFDVWLPELAPSTELMAQGKAAQTDAQWARFARAFKAELSKSSAIRTLDLLAALSQHADFSIGCYCEREERCHRSVLRSLLAQRNASFRD